MKIVKHAEELLQAFVAHKYVPDGKGRWYSTDNVELSLPDTVFRYCRDEISGDIPLEGNPWPDWMLIEAPDLKKLCKFWNSEIEPDNLDEQCVFGHLKSIKADESDYPYVALGDTEYKYHRRAILEDLK